MMKAPAIAAELESAATDLRAGNLATISLYWTAPSMIIGDFIVSRNPDILRSPDENDIAFANKLEALSVKLRVNPDKVTSIRVTWPAEDEKPQECEALWTTP